jgi:tRNA threonylcarbamoyladenosine biosynthesis protein TsaE
MHELIIESKSPADTDRIGQQLGVALATGHVIALIGPLGAGKTALVKGIVSGAGIGDRRQVNSPTFVIVNEYRCRPNSGPLRIYHIDAYRLRGGDDLSALGFDEMITQGAVIIEWADRVADILPAERLTIVLEPVGETHRRLHLTAAGPGNETLLTALA